MTNTKVHCRTGSLENIRQQQQEIRKLHRRIIYNFRVDMCVFFGYTHFIINKQEIRTCQQKLEQ